MSIFKTSRSLIIYNDVIFKPAIKKCSNSSISNPQLDWELLKASDLIASNIDTIESLGEVVLISNILHLIDFEIILSDKKLKSSVKIEENMPLNNIGKHSRIYLNTDILNEIPTTMFKHCYMLTTPIWI